MVVTLSHDSAAGYLDSLAASIPYHLWPGSGKVYKSWVPNWRGIRVC